GDEHVQAVVQAADCLLAPGTLVTDHYLDLVQQSYDKMILAELDQIRIGYHSYVGVALKDFLEALIAKFKADERYPLKLALLAQGPLPAPPGPELPITYEAFLQRITQFLDRWMSVLADLSMSLHVAPRLRIPRSSGFVAQAAWEAIGYAMGAVVGVGCAAPDRRAVVIVGDGGFQMTCQAISTMVRQKQ